MAIQPLPRALGAAQRPGLLSPGLGAALSNGVAGYVVDRAGYNAAFLFLAACATVALIVLGLMTPETYRWAQRAPGPVAGTASQHGFG